MFWSTDKIAKIIRDITNNNLWPEISAYALDKSDRLPPSKANIAKLNQKIRTLLGIKGFASVIDTCHSSITKFCQTGTGPIGQTKSILRECQAEKAQSLVREILDEIADGVGLCVIQSPPSDIPAPLHWIKLFSSMLADFSDFSREFSDALNSDDITKEDMQFMLASLKRARRTYNDAIGQLEFHLCNEKTLNEGEE
jgi:hypothetical protein